MLISQVRKAIKKATGAEKVQLMTPKHEKFGDFSVNVMSLRGRASDSGNDQENEITADSLAGDLSINPLFEKVTVMGAFVNMFVSKKKLNGELQSILKKPSDYLHNNGLNSKKYMVEFAHPNTHKIFHIGHLRNITIGESLVRILQSSHAEVIRANYQGDVGLHIAKCLYQIQKSDVDINTLQTLDEKVSFLGKAYADGNTAYENDKTAKEEIHEINKKIYSKDPEIKELWEETRQWSLDYFDSVYKRVGTTYDRFYFESEVADRGLEVAHKAVEDGILKKDDGAIILDGEEHNVDTRVFVNQLGLPTYEGKDLGLAELEFTEFGNIDKCIHVVGPEQKSYFKTVFKALELINPELYKGKEHHFAYGFVDLKDGKMSSRSGNVMAGMDLLDTVQARVKETFDLNDEAAAVIAVGAVKYAFLKVDATKNIAFDIDESISTKGNSGPYIQYAYARIQSMLKKASVDSPETNQGSQANTLSQTTLDTFSEEDLSLLRALPGLQEAVYESSLSYSPHVICAALYDIAQKFSALYENQPILKEENTDLRYARLALIEATANLLKEGLHLLGIDVRDEL